MAVMTVAEIKAVLGRDVRLLGLDMGTKTIGLALSDVGLMIATPLMTLRRRKLGLDIAALRSTINEHGVGGLVVGLPVSMDGNEGPRCQAVRQFVTDLLKDIDIPVAYWDERLSTMAVERILIGEADLTRKRRAQVVDKVAAGYILQGALDALAHQTSRQNT